MNSIYVTKNDIQSIFRATDWQLHIIIDPGYVTRVGDEVIQAQLRELNYRLCKRLLHRRFAKFPLDDRIHWVGFPDGMRDAGTRHAHLLMHIPPSVSMGTDFQRLKVKSRLQSEWLRVSDRYDPYFLWARWIDGCADNWAVATYVSRELTPRLWELEELWFSQ